MALVYVIVRVAYLAISILQLLMMIRAIMSWLPFDDSNALYRFVICTTEPIIIPIRNLLDRIGFFANLPIDISFLVAYLLLTFVMYLLPAVNL